MRAVRQSIGPVLRIAAASAAFAALIPSAALAVPRPAAFRALSANGAAVAFTTAESLVPTDGDNAVDVYTRAGGVTAIASDRPSGDASTPATFRALSGDGSIVVFTTAESLVPTDADNAVDVYTRAGGVTSIASDRPSGDASTPATFRALSGDGSLVVFTTAESLVPTDGDNAVDVYTRAGGVTSIASDRPSGDASTPATFRALSGDGSLVVFTTAESLVPTDGDNAVDVYTRAGGVTCDRLGSPLRRREHPRDLQGALGRRLAGRLHHRRVAGPHRRRQRRRRLHPRRRRHRDRLGSPLRRREHPRDLQGALGRRLAGRLHHRRVAGPHRRRQRRRRLHPRRRRHRDRLGSPLRRREHPRDLQGALGRRLAGRLHHRRVAGPHRRRQRRRRLHPRRRRHRDRLGSPLRRREHPRDLQGALGRRLAGRLHHRRVAGPHRRRQRRRRLHPRRRRHRDRLGSPLRRREHPRDLQGALGRRLPSRLHHRRVAGPHRRRQRRRRLHPRRRRHRDRLGSPLRRREHPRDLQGALGRRLQGDLRHRRAARLHRLRHAHRRLQPRRRRHRAGLRLSAELELGQDRGGGPRAGLAGAVNRAALHRLVENAK